MKKTLTFLIVLFCLQSNFLVAQTKAELEDMYLIKRKPDVLLFQITNKADTLIGRLAKSCKSIEIEETVPLYKLLSDIFTKEKVKTLAEMQGTISMHFVTDFDGNVLNVSLILVRANLTDSPEDLIGVSLMEFHQIEGLLKKYQFKLSNLDCPDMEYISFGSKPFRFDELLQYLEKEN